MASVQIFVLNIESTSGQELNDLYQKIDKYEAENSQLRQKIASASSIATISQKAQNYGLNDPQQVFSLSSRIPIALSDNLSL